MGSSKPPSIKCLFSPYPFTNGCSQDVFPSHQKLLDAKSKIQIFFKNVAHSQRQNFLGDLENLAKDFTCEKHGENGVEFAYHWLAETPLPSMLDHMGWKIDSKSWVCLGSDRDPKCPGLKPIEPKHKRDRVYCTLNKLALGGIHVKEALQVLMKHWLCQDHKHKAQELIPQFLGQLMEYKTGKKYPTEVPNPGNRDTLSSPNATDHESRGNMAGEDEAGQGFDDPSDLTDFVDQDKDYPESPTPNGRNRQYVSPPPSSTSTGSDASNATPKGRRPPIYQSSSEKIQRAKARDTKPAPYQRRAVSTTGHPTELRDESDGSRKRRRISETLGREHSPFDQESAGPHSYTERNPSNGGSDPDKDAPRGEQSAGSDSPKPSSVHEGEPPFPHWRRRGDTRTRPDIVDSICKLMAKPAFDSGKGPDDGWIYICRSPIFPGYVKIGRTTAGIRDRMDQIENRCKSYSLNLADKKECYNKISCHKRVEQLIHEDLSNKRRCFTCTCKVSHHKHNSEEDGKKGTEHSEWFKIDETRAKEVVKKWKDWARLNPYSWDGRPTWDTQKNVDRWQRDTESFDRPVASVEPLLLGMPWWGRYAAWVMRKCFQPRPKGSRREPQSSKSQREPLHEGPSLWVSIREKWKDHLVFVVACWGSSFVVCCVLIFWSWKPSVALAMAAPLFWILFTA